MHNVETFHRKTIVAAEDGGFRFEADFFKAVPMIIVFSVMDSIETFQNQNMVASENVAF